MVAVAGIAAVVSYRHMRAVALQYGEDPLNSTIIPVSVDGLIVAASMSMLSASRARRKPPWLAYTLLILGSVASLSANVIHADPQLTARIIAAWPSAALIGAYELLIRQIRDTGYVGTAAIRPGMPGTSHPADAITLASAETDRPQAPEVTSPAEQNAGIDEPDPAAQDDTDLIDAPSREQPAVGMRHDTDTVVTPLYRVDPPRRGGTKRARLCALVADIPPDDPRSTYALARDLVPRVDLHEGTARRYIAEIRATGRHVQVAGHATVQQDLDSPPFPTKDLYLTEFGPISHRK